METIADVWQETDRGLPTGWHLQGLRCASNGLRPDLRSERWLAEACGPNGECERIEMDTAEGALRGLTALLRQRD